MSLSKEDLIDRLHEGLVELEFTKSDGSNRTMLCTLNEDYIAPWNKVSGKRKNKNPDVISVYDAELEEWRSFHYSKLVRIHGEGDDSPIINSPIINKENVQLIADEVDSALEELKSIKSRLQNILNSLYDLIDE